MEKMGGGGDEFEAGASIKNSTIKDIEEELIKIIKKLD